MATPALSLEADQQTSAVEKDSPQNDRWRSEEITTRLGGTFMLLVVADGEGETAPGEAADLAVEVAFAEARLRRDDPLPKLLAHLLDQMNEIIFRRGGGNIVGVTMAAIQADVVWLVQAGSQTRCYHVHGDRSAALLTNDNDFPLGRRQFFPHPVVGTYRLKRGDKLVLCSDGLFAEDLVSPGDIARIDRYREVKGAARHLSALAMGRNVRDNVTVVVAAYGRKSGLTLKLLPYYLLACAAATAIILIGVLVLQKILRPISRPPDFGVAVLVEGNATQVEPLQIIHPGSDVNAAPDSPIHISLKRRESPESVVTQTIPNIDLYFGPGTATNLAAIDVEGFTDPARGIKESTNLAEVSLFEGEALLLSKQAHTFYIWLGLRDNSQTPFVIVRGLPAALGIERRESQISAYCLQGTCSIIREGKSTPIPPGAKMSFSLDDPGDSSFSSASLDLADWERWLSLCRTWQTDPEEISEACSMLMP